MRGMPGMRGMVAAGTALAVVAATACGDDGDGGDPGGSPSAGAAPVALPGTVNDHGTKDAGAGGDVEVELDDFYFGPTFVRGKATTAYTLKLKNEGDVVHTFTVDGFPVDVTVQPGATADASLSLPASGAVRFYCRFHAGQGMQGAFFLNPGDTVTNTGSGGGASSAPSGDGDGAYNQ